MMTPVQNGRRTSEVLQQIIDESDDGAITIEHFTRLLGDRAFALLILIFALPNSLPMPGIPGFSTITGLPIVLFALQMVQGRETVWLPVKVGARRFSQAKLKAILKKVMPAVKWLERYLHPRWSAVRYPLSERFLGLMFMTLALVMSLPIPGGNFLPGLSLSLIALGMLERDGLFVACAVGFSCLSLFLMYELIALFFTAVLNFVLTSI